MESSAMTLRARSSLRSTSALMALASEVSAWLAMVRSFCFKAAISCSKCRVIFDQQSSAEAARDIIFGLLFRGICKDFPRAVVFDQLAEIEESGVIGDARGLLHVVRDDDD